MVPSEEKEADCYDYCCCVGCSTSTAREAGEREQRSGVGGWKGGRVALGRALVVEEVEETFFSLPREEDEERARRREILSSDNEGWETAASATGRYNERTLAARHL
ncbi:hypothetical protein GW17_00061846 [Ensete ventricosum]|nr:hypothetical protein GW17_00061846 [Ensete ventricosum]